MSITTEVKDAIFDASAEAMVICNSKGEILDINQRCVDLFGYSKTELVGQRIERLLPENMRNVHERYRKQYHQAPRNRPMGGGNELYGRKKDGEEIPLAISLGNKVIDGEAYVIGFIIDITQLIKSSSKEAASSTLY